MRRLLLPLLIGLAAASPVSAQSLLHSDTPLFADVDDPWPRHFFDADGFGCSSMIPFGLWKRTEAAEGGEEPPFDWLRIDNYGVLHCAYIVLQSDGEPKDWNNAEYAWIGELGEADGPDGDPLRLYALQLGFRPGSSYLLLARKPGKDMTRRFFVLNWDCPPGWSREGKSTDVWRSDYCAVPHLAGLRRIARAAAKAPPAATLEYVEDPPPGAELDD